MYSVDSLEHAIGQLYRSGIGEGRYDAADVEELLDGLDCHSLVQAVRHKAETPYVYATQGNQPKSFNYRSRELFDQRATLLYDEFDRCTAEVALTTRSWELWLLEDMTFAAVACVSVAYEDEAYVTRYREIKGDPWECGMCPDLEELTVQLDRMSWSAYEDETPVYEL